MQPKANRASMAPTSGVGRLRFHREHYLRAIRSPRTASSRKAVIVQSRAALHRRSVARPSSVHEQSSTTQDFTRSHNKIAETPAQLAQPRQRIEGGDRGLLGRSSAGTDPLAQSNDRPDIAVGELPIPTGQSSPLAECRARRARWDPRPDGVSLSCDLRSAVRAGRSGIVKGFRMPARHRRKGMHGGRRPKSLEGGNRGGVCDGGGVDLWGFGAGA
jgi:hypothetical protein